jgi:hypothetical protein
MSAPIKNSRCPRTSAIRPRARSIGRSSDHAHSARIADKCGHATLEADGHPLQLGTAVRSIERLSPRAPTRGLRRLPLIQHPGRRERLTSCQTLRSLSAKGCDTHSSRHGTSRAVWHVRLLSGHAPTTCSIHASTASTPRKTWSGGLLAPPILTLTVSRARPIARAPPGRRDATATAVA